MSSAILHIKDSYFFEVPKALWRSKRAQVSDFPDVWISLDDDYLQWEARRFIDAASERDLEIGNPSELLNEYSQWMHAAPRNSGRPFGDFLVESAWYRDRQAALQAKAESDHEGGVVGQSAKELAADAKAKLDATLSEVQAEARDVRAYAADAHWDEAKIQGYNKALNGKILIPQPFGQLRNLHEPGQGFCISKFMIIEVVVALILAVLFIRLASRMRKSDQPKGRMWNLLESMLVYMRDQVARPAIGHHEGDRYVPLLWTIFFFILGMNLMGMVPWVGAPTSAFAVTLGLAAVTLLTGIIMGSIKFGPIGYWLNQIPHMDLPWYIAIFIKPMIWAIEVLGMFIKHGVLGVRLLANMVAGHLVLLGFMAIAFSLQGASSDQWWLAAVISVVGSAAFSLLELFVAFLQAYIFTFLSALFIGAAVHHH